MNLNISIKESLTMVKNPLKYHLVLLLLAIALFMSSALAERPDKTKYDNKQTPFGIAQTKNAAILNINNITTWQRGDGQGQYGPPSLQGDGGIFPRGTSFVLFADGFVWGTKCYLDAAHTQPAPVQVIRVGGNTYNVGNQIGWIEGTGSGAQAISQSDSRARIYRIRRDYTTMSVQELTRDAAENNLVLTNQVSSSDIDAVVAQYRTDWDEWPVDLGAPYIERNSIPGYQKPPAFGPNFTVESLIAGNYDEPGLAGIDPNSPANQVVWTVFNDLNRGNMIGFAGSEPMGLEMQLTLWGYKRSDALGNGYFKRIKIINKGGADIGGGNRGSLYLDSMYVSQWSDPDLGSFGDDISGCDPAISMGFVYNGNADDANFSRFNLPPPAVGYDFLAGPAVPGAVTDTAVFDLKKKPGYKNLPLTSFAYFSAGSGIADPPFSYEGALRWWRMLQGYVPDESTAPLRLYPHPPGVTETVFPLSGDPFAGTGFLDGLGTSYSFAPGDRRIVHNTGPFSLAPGDTQEVVVGVVAGLGGDRLSSVAIMKANDRAIQTTYDLLFQVSQPPASPLVSATELNGRVILEWGSNLGRVNQTENTVSQPGSYVFEGYNIYQLPTPSSQLTDNGVKRIATYDVDNSTGVILETEFDITAGQFLPRAVQFGTNSGVRRYFELSRDHVRDIDKLYNGQEYYVAVTAYSRSTDPGFAAALESSPIVYVVRPQKPYGTATQSNFRDTIAVSRVQGPSDGGATALVISSTQLSSDSYEIRFNSSGGTWFLVNTTTGDTVLTDQSNQDGDDGSPIVDGVQVKVFGAPDDVKDFLTTANGAGALDPPEYGAFAFNDSEFPHPTTADRPTGSRQQSTGGLGTSQGWGIHTGAGGIAGDFSFDRFKARVFRNGGNFAEFIPYDWEIRFTAAGGKGWAAFTTGAFVDVPFEIWNIGINTPNDPSDDYRAIPWFNDIDANDQWNIAASDHPISGGTNDPETDWIYWYLPTDRSPGQSGYMNEFVNRGTAYDGTDGNGNDHAESMARMVLAFWNGGDATDPSFPANLPQTRPENGTVFRIIGTKPNTTLDIFSFNTSSYAASQSTALEKTSVERVTVFPNPYYAFNPAETNRFVRFVTINNLPPKAKVRIFNLAGQLVRTLDKDDNSQFLRWDLNNSDNFPVASGMYIAHLEMTLSDGSTATKILKIAVIQEQEVPDVF